MEEQPTPGKPAEATPTVSDKTRARYLKVILRWKRRLQEELGLDDLKVTADMLIDNLIERQGEWKQNTIRYNRAALREWIKNESYFTEQEARRLLVLFRVEDTSRVLIGLAFPT